MLRQPGSGPGSVGVSAVEPPVQDGRHITCCSQVASAGGCQQVAERVRSGFGGEVEQAGSEGWPGWFSGESGDVVVGLVELCHGLGSEELFGRDGRLSV